MREIRARAVIIFVLMPLFLFFVETCPAFDQAYEKAPEKLQAALIIKILAMSKEINTGEPISIHVLNAPAAAAELKKAVDRKIGKSILADVRDSNMMPVEWRARPRFISADMTTWTWKRSSITAVKTGY